jgi:hypothetical protein
MLDRDRDIRVRAFRGSSIPEELPRQINPEDQRGIRLHDRLQRLVLLIQSECCTIHTREFSRKNRHKIHALSANGNLETWSCGILPLPDKLGSWRDSVRASRELTHRHCIRQHSTNGPARLFSKIESDSSEASGASSAHPLRSCCRCGFHDSSWRTSYSYDDWNVSDRLGKLVGISAVRVKSIATCGQNLEIDAESYLRCGRSTPCAVRSRP